MAKKPPHTALNNSHWRKAISMSQFPKKILSKKLFSKTLKNAHQGETISIQILRGKVCSNQLVQN